MRSLKLGVPDLVSNSYFAAIAAVELGAFAQHGIAASIELIYPGNRTFAALRNGEIELVAAPAHSALAVFPGWKGCCLWFSLDLLQFQGRCVAVSGATWQTVPNLSNRQWPEVSYFVARCESQKPIAMLESHVNHLQFSHGSGFFYLHNVQNV